METKVYKYKNGTIFVTIPKSFDRERLKSATEDFLKKVIVGGKKSDYSGQTSNF